MIIFYSTTATENDVIILRVFPDIADSEWLAVKEAQMALSCDRKASQQYLAFNS